MQTKAPWTIEIEQVRRGAKIVVVAATNVVCRVGPISTNVNDDARLICAAPDLLAACQAYLTAHATTNAAEYVRAMSAAAEQIRAAVEKAAGP